MNSISEQISCPVCLEITEGEIFLCRNGHNICGGCSRSMIHCPQCRVPYGKVKVRNRTVEAIVQSLKVDCPNKANGCPERLLPDTLEAHKNACQYSANNIKLCQLIGLNCGHKIHIKNVSSIIQHLQTRHGATTLTVSKFVMKLSGFSSHYTVIGDRTWGPHVIELADSNIVISAKIKNDMLSCMGVILEESTVQQNRRTMEYKINSLANQDMEVLWRSPVLSLSEIVKRTTAPPGPVRMDYIRHYAMSADGSLSIHVCISQPKALRDYLIDGTGGGRDYPESVIAKSMYDYVGDQNKTLSMKMGDIVQVIEKGTDGWCLCELHGNVGYVPILLIDFSIQQKPGTKELSLPETKMQALCLYPYEAWNEEEITLKKGDVVRVISKIIYHGWWQCEFNGNTGLVPENKLTLVSDIESSKPDKKSTNVVTKQFRWVKCNGGQCGTRQNSVRYIVSAVRAAIPGLNVKVPGCLRKGETTAVICFKNVAFRVSEYEILCIPGGYWKYSQKKNWGKLIPEGSISTGISPDGTETYLGFCNGFVSINAKGGYCYEVTCIRKDDSVERETEYYFILETKP